MEKSIECTRCRQIVVPGSALCRDHLAIGADPETDAEGRQDHFRPGYHFHEHKCVTCEGEIADPTPAQKKCSTCRKAAREAHAKRKLRRCDCGRVIRSRALSCNKCRRKDCGEDRRCRCGNVIESQATKATACAACRRSWASHK